MDSNKSDSKESAKSAKSGKSAASLQSSDSENSFRKAYWKIGACHPSQRLKRKVDQKVHSRKVLNQVKKKMQADKKSKLEEQTGRRVIPDLRSKEEIKQEEEKAQQQNSRTVKKGEIFSNLNLPPEIDEWFEIPEDPDKENLVSPIGHQPQRRPQQPRPDPEEIKAHQDRVLAALVAQQVDQAGDIEAEQQQSHGSDEREVEPVEEMKEVQIEELAQLSDRENEEWEDFDLESCGEHEDDAAQAHVMRYLVQGEEEITASRELPFKRAQQL